MMNCCGSKEATKSEVHAAVCMCVGLMDREKIKLSKMTISKSAFEIVSELLIDGKFINTAWGYVEINHDQ